jgi:lipopolysaccharide transport system ATP-binding protein
MSNTVIRVENISKLYRLGEVGTGTLQHDLNRWWHRIRGKEDPYLKVGQANDRTVKGGGEYVWALKDINFEVKRGEVLGIIGRNGAGKSTLLKILSRVTTPTTGEIKIKGRVASLLEVGTGFNPELTGRDNIYLNGAILGMRKREIDEKFDEIVEFSGVERYVDTPVKRYSSGMYVRLAFAVAAHLEPEILIVDEVLAVGDAEFQKKCLGKMQDVAGHGRTILFVSHNMSAVRSLCTSGIMLQSGTLLEVGPTEKIVDRYLANSHDLSRVVMDLDAVNRSGDMGSRLKVTRLVFNEGTDIRHGQALRIDLHFKASTAAEEVAFGLGFCNRDGIRLFSMDTDIPGERLKIAAGSSGRITFTIPVLHLEPDFYLIDVGVRSGDNFTLDYAPSCGLAAVIPSEATPSVIAMRETGRGGFRQPSEWRVEYHNV